MTASGIHPEPAPNYIRNVQLNKETEVAQLLKKTNPYMVEESVWSSGKTDFVASFPITTRKGSIYREEVIGTKLLELVKKAQQFWVEPDLELCVDKTVRHNISNTILVDNWEEVEEYVFNNRQYFTGVSFLSLSGDKDYAQAPFTKVIEGKELIKTYGNGSIFASGLIVDALKTFDNLWIACMTANNIGDDLSIDDSDNSLKRDWIRRFDKFSANYFKGDRKLAEYCLKDVYNLHKWEKIVQNIQPIDWTTQLSEKKFTDIDTMGSIACAGGECEI
jgi:ribonucleoside-diphosphate reductase alpha chain